jgi:MFS family permease
MKLLTRAFVLLVVAHFLQALGYASLLLLPPYLQHLGASRTEIGTIGALGAAAGVATRPLVGWALDAWGRKPTIVAGTLMAVAGMVLIGWVDRMGPTIYLARIVFGIGAGTLFAGYFTLAADIVPAGRRTEGLALFGISGLVPLFVNPLSDRIGVATADLRWFLPLMGAVILLSLGALLALPRSAGSAAAKPSARAALRALRKRPLWPVWLATFAFSALVAVFMTFAAVTAERRGVSHAATLWLGYGVGAIGVRLVGARLPDRIGPANLVAPAFAAYVVGMLLAAQAETLDGFVVAALFAGVGHGYCFPVLTSQVVSRTPVPVRGSALALFTALWGGSELVVSPLFGAVADRHGDAAMFWVGAVGGIGALGLWLGLEHRLGERRLGPASGAGGSAGAWSDRQALGAAKRSRHPR